MKSSKKPTFLFVVFIVLLAAHIKAFTINHFALKVRQTIRDGQQVKFSTRLGSFVADSSDYKSSDSDFSSDDEKSSEYGAPVSDSDEEEDESPTLEESPVPMSKNAGNRFLAFVFDKSLLSNGDDVDVMELHENRISLTEDHVMYCRKANLYNETFNTESMADILWSYQLLSSDLRRTVGHAMCIESKTLEHAQKALANDPIVQMLTKGDISKIPFYRWRHIRDHTLRMDDGRGGIPNLLISMDRLPEEVPSVPNLRDSVHKDYLEYLIRSERVIAAGPLHLPTELKDDASSIPVGDFVLFNSPNRQSAIEFAENSPAAQAGLYESMKLHRFNSLDVTGKFVATDLVDPQKTKRTEEMKDALEYWGYPVGDQETKWLNW
mmetsp:Transcript_12816/g.24048  ORF Transcript_12816/g.24048 Transcript_12816/m.24048 type:complete len:379 (-) Transcript_12816:82-1218(-)